MLLEKLEDERIRLEEERRRSEEERIKLQKVCIFQLEELIKFQVETYG